jgi:FkbM family methyltransferase
MDIFNYINIENGFYIEAGGYDGVLQSYTKILEDKYNWTGILIEPSPTMFDTMKNNRPNNIHINKCLVSNDYKENTVIGAFDCGPMSSVNNMRNIECDNMISVPCSTLTNILDKLNINKIDLFSLDVEGYEFDVLQGLDFIKYTPTFLLIEIYNVEKDNIFNFLELNNYILIANITNYNLNDNPGWDETHQDYLFKYNLS